MHGSAVRALGAARVGLGLRGELHMALMWTYEPGVASASSPRRGPDAPRKQPSVGCPLSQLTANSNETNLRLGNVSELMDFLSSLPVRPLGARDASFLPREASRKLHAGESRTAVSSHTSKSPRRPGARAAQVLLRIGRCTIRDFEFYLKDLFLAEGLKGYGDAEAVSIALLDFRRFHNRLVGPITVWQFLFSFFVEHAIPAVLKQSHAVLNAALQISKAGSSHLGFFNKALGIASALDGVSAPRAPLLSSVGNLDEMRRCGAEAHLTSPPVRLGISDLCGMHRVSEGWCGSRGGSCGR
eukprot:scaffold249790_cov22-Tisochrysis_lutea.AAC.2